MSYQGPGWGSQQQPPQQWGPGQPQWNGGQGQPPKKRALPLWAIGVIAGLFLACMLGVSINERREHAREEQQNRVAAAHHAVAQASAQTAARASAPQQVATASALAAQAETAVEAGRYLEAVPLLTQAEAQLQPLLIIVPPLPEVSALVTRIAAIRHTAEQEQRLIAVVSGAQGLATEAPAAYVEYDSRLEQTLTELRSPAVTLPRIATDRNAAVALLERRRVAIQSRVRREQTEATARAAAGAALAARCGGNPGLGWDDELGGSEAYVRQGANDPGSIDVSACTPPVLTQRECWVSTCNVRGRNAFGATVLSRVRFTVAHDRILSAGRE